MKFSQKIFLITFAFVTITINLIGIIIINNNYQTQLNEKIKNNISNIDTLCSNLKFYGIINVHKKDNTYYEITKDNDIIYTNLLLDMESVKDRITPTEEIKAIIVDETLFMSTKKEEYDIILAENIENVFTMRDEQISFFIKVSFIFSFIIALGLYIIINLLTRKIKKLNKAVNEIAKGDYKSRVKNLGKDEVGELAESFNSMAQSIEMSIENIERVSTNRQNFINDMTHEMRTPLTSIIGYSSLIKNKKVCNIDDILDYNNKIYEEGNYLNLLSQRLMDIVLLDNQKLELEYMNVSKIIAEIIEKMKFEYNDVQFIKTIEENISFNCDKVLLYSLIQNIIKNSIIAYEDVYQKVVEISFEKKEEKKVLLKIIDYGKGMSEEQINKITEPFYTLNKDRNRKKSGMGLGLTLCVKICEVLNSKLKILSTLGKGTTVIIEFNI